MAKRVIWSPRAQEDRKSIFSYWNEHNKSKSFSRKLNKLINEAIRIITEHPYIGRKTVIENVHVKIVRQYLIIYEVRDKEIVILSIWDGRRDPDKML